MKSILTVLVSGIVLSLAGLAADSHRPLTNSEAEKMSATAATPADHLRLAKYFELKAVKLDAEAKEHASMARNFRSQPSASETKRPGAADTATHCEKLAQDLAQAAKDARMLASDQEAMSKQQ